MSDLQMELDRLERLLIETIALANPPVKSGNSTVTINAGGTGLVIAVVCCIAMIVALVIAVPIAVGAYIDTRADIRQLENTDNAIRAYINTGKMPPAPAEKK